VFTKTVRNVAPEVGEVSLIGVGKNLPASWANYFSFACGLRCVNMWAENMEEIVRRKQMTYIEVTVFNDGKYEFGAVSDSRVPKEWLIPRRHGGLCFTGGWRPTREVMEALLEFADVPQEERRKRICGCEEPNQRPCIGYMSQNGETEDVHGYHCQHCDRRWEIRVPHPKREPVDLKGWKITESIGEGAYNVKALGALVVRDEKPGH